MHVEVLAENPPGRERALVDRPAAVREGPHQIPVRHRLATDTLRPGRLGDPPCRPRPAVGRGAAGGGAVRMAEETDTMLQPTQGGGREGGSNASYKRL
jgi:hypothetical protein